MKQLNCMVKFVICILNWGSLGYDSASVDVEKYNKLGRQHFLFFDDKAIK